MRKVQLIETFAALAMQLVATRCVLCRQAITSTSDHQNQQNLCDYCCDDLNTFDYSWFDDLMLRPDIERGITRPKFDRLLSVAPYQWPYNQWIGDMKFREKFAIAELMGHQLADLLDTLIQANPALKPDVLLPMPIHRQRRFSRGYNQSYLLASVLAKRLNIALDIKALKRIKATNAQSQLGKRERNKNIKNAFAYQGNQYQHVALIDDVITTGATVNEACKVLSASGVAAISVWTICATPLGNKQ
ncbi:MAG: ComF family protein [Phenylobacterium sp.]|jgi:ComF family protein